MFSNKFNITLKQNIFLAKKLITETIYNTAKLEGCNVTFPQTETILNGISIAGVKMIDVEKILNLRDAWRHTLNTIETPITLETWSKVNEFVARNESLDWGVLRYGKVGISGTPYVPPMPIADKVESDIYNMQYSSHFITATEIALNMFLYGCRSQLFWDGNKRTSTIITNKYMIQNGIGIFSIPDKKLEIFSNLLSEFYTTNEVNKVKNFLYQHCIRGLEIL